MPRAFDRGQLRITHDPIARIDTALPRTPAFAGGALDIFADCTNPFLAGVASLGTGATMTAQLGTGLQAFIDGLLGPLLAGSLTALTPQQILGFVDSIRTALLDNIFVAGIVDLIGGISGNGIINDIVAGFQQFTDTLLGGFGFPLWTDIVTAITNFFGWLFNELGVGVESVLKPIAEFLNWLFTGLATGAPPPTTGNAAADALLQPLFSFFAWVWDLFGDAVESVLQPIFTFLHWVFVGLPAGNPPPSTGNAFADSVLQPLFSFLAWVWDLFGDAVESVLQPIFTWLGWLWRLFANITPNPAPTGPGANILVPLFTWLDDLWDKLGATVLAAFNNLINAISGLIPLPTLQSLIEKISVALTGIINPQSFVDMLVKIIEYFKSLFITGSITDFTKNIPIIGPLVSAITGLTEADGVALDFGTVDRFFRELEQKATVSKDSLTEIGNKILGGILSIGMLNTSEPNLLSQGDFATAVTVESAGGWSWDNTVSATSTGGALRATATGSLQQIYSKQSIKTATNDKIKVSASVLTSGFTSGSMVLSIIPWIGTVQQTTHVVSTRTSAASTFQPMTGSTIVIGGTAGAGEISLPAGVTSIQVRLAVNANSGAKVWFDDIAVRKTGLVEQSWVDKLPETWAGAWNAVFGSGGAGKIWSDFISALGTVNYYAGQGFTNAGTANGNITTMIDGIGQAVFGDAGYATLSKTVKQSIRTLVSTLFGLPYVAPELSGDVLPPIDGTTITGEIPVGAVPDLPGGIITTGQIPVTAVPYLPADKINSGTININYLPKDSLGLLGSGASMYRSTAAGNYGVSNTTNPLNNCFNTLESATSDITYNVALASFTPQNAGWYRVEMGLRINGNLSTSYNICPLIYVGGSIYRRGQDGVGIFINGSGRGVRFVQCSFQVYVNGNQSITAGYDSDTALNTLIVGDPTTTYFGITLLNRSYA